MKKDIMDFTFALGVVVLLFIFLLVVKTLLVWGAWNFLIVPVWGATKITLIQSLCLWVFVYTVVPFNNAKAEKKETK
mgnify:CR=1 FL=1